MLRETGGNGVLFKSDKEMAERRDKRTAHVNKRKAAASVAKKVAALKAAAAAAAPASSPAPAPSPATGIGFVATEDSAAHSETSACR